MHQLHEIYLRVKCYLLMFFFKSCKDDPDAYSTMNSMFYQLIDDVGNMEDDYPVILETKSYLVRISPKNQLDEVIVQQPHPSPEMFKTRSSPPSPEMFKTRSSPPSPEMFKTRSSPPSPEMLKTRSSPPSPEMFKTGSFDSEVVIINQNGDDWVEGDSI